MARYHFSRLIAGGSAGLLLGALASQLLKWNEFKNPIWILGALILFSMARRGRTKAALGAAILSGMILGLFFTQNKSAQLSSWEPFYKETVKVSGRISDDVVASPQGLIKFKLAGIRIDDDELPGQLWVSLKSEVALARGDYIWVSGYLSPGFGRVSASMHRANFIRAQRPYPGDFSRRIRDRLADYIRLSLPEPQASLGISFLLGWRQALPVELAQRLRLLGLAHIVVASGFHLTIMVGLVRSSLGRLSQYLNLIIGLLVIFWMLLLTGFSSSMNRAAIVTGLGLIAWYFGRRVHPVIILLLAAAITVAVDPTLIWGDIGWYLSFASFAGVIVVAPMLHLFFWGYKKPSWLRQLLVATLGAQLATLPIVILAFSQYSPLSLLANLLILPLLPLAIGMTLLAGLGAAMLPGLAGIIGWPAYVVLKYMTLVSEKLSALPWARGEFSMSVAQTAIYYLLLLAGMVYLWHQTKWNPLTSPE